MRRATFSTGLRHQRDVALWARRRVVDANGRWFDTSRRRIEQFGVIIADGVGLGKTWEALAVSALILFEGTKQRRHKNRRRNVRKRPAHVLVLCPSGLVTKWSHEVRDTEGFFAKLHKWASGRRRRQFVLRTLKEPYEIRRRTDLPQGRLGRGGVTLPPGTYVCNWNVFRKNVGSGRSRLAALRNQSWDVVIVDEAHHSEARQAIETILAWTRDVGPLLLLTATPFQLDPRELHHLLGAILDKRQHEHRVLTRSPVKQFVSAMSDYFNGGKLPLRSSRRAAEKILQQVICRSHVRTGGRKYFVIDEEGEAKSIQAPEHLREAQVRTLLSELVAASPNFEAWYLERRLRLAAGNDGNRTYIPNTLRQMLHTPGQARASGAGTPPLSPRLEALRTWAQKQVVRDLIQTASDGWPRKTLVFTSFVSRAAGDLRETMQKVVESAWKEAREHYAWKRLAREAEHGVLLVTRNIEGFIGRDLALSRSSEAQELVRALQNLSITPGKEFVHQLFGHQRFRRILVADLRRRLKALSQELISSQQEDKWWERLHREERRNLRNTVKALGRFSLVATYTGHDDRREREASGEAFRSPLAPWILIASNVGSEGIDLHTFSAHLIHFDIEWNPARMEQREGRIDRLGRKLKDAVNVYFIFVRGTYDERMLHQLIVRQRWHSVLLGREGARLARDNKGTIRARWITEENVEKLALDLRPIKRSYN